MSPKIIECSRWLEFTRDKTGVLQDRDSFAAHLNAWIQHVAKTYAHHLLERVAGKEYNEEAYVRHYGALARETQLGLIESSRRDEADAAHYLYWFTVHQNPTHQPPHSDTHNIKIIYGKHHASPLAQDFLRALLKLQSIKAALRAVDKEFEDPIQEYDGPRFQEHWLWDWTLAQEAHAHARGTPPHKAEIHVLAQCEQWLNLVRSDKKLDEECLEFENKLVHHRKLGFTSGTYARTHPYPALARSRFHP